MQDEEGGVICRHATKLPLARFMMEAEAEYIAAKLEEAGGNQSEAARLAGCPLNTFHKKVKKYGLQVEVVKVRITRPGRSAA